MTAPATAGQIEIFRPAGSWFVATMRPLVQPRRMTSQTDELREDHAIVRAGLRALAAIGEHVRRGGHFPAEDTATLLRLLREFFVATHMRKENEVVWPAMAMRGDSTAAAIVGRLMFEQEEATELINTLVVFWEPAGELTAEERLGFADTVDALQTRVLLMLESEEKLFTACPGVVPPDDRVDWPAQFAAIAATRTPRSAWSTALRRIHADWLA